MQENELDLLLARMEKEDITVNTLEEDIEKLRKKSVERLDNIRSEVQKAINLKIERKDFFEHLFSICLPSDLGESEIKEDNVIVLRSKLEKLVVVIKKIDDKYPINLEDIKKSYEAQMKQSKQQTQFCLSESRIVNEIQISYFAASHTMPKQKHYNYIVLFHIKNKTIILNFNIREKEYSYWESVIDAMIESIRQGEEYEE